ALGGNSLLAVRMAAGLRALHGREVPVLRVFEHPTIRGLLAALSDSARTDTLALRVQRAKSINPGAREPVAIVGLACRFPGADDVESLWRVLTEGKETISFFKPEELDP